MNVVPTFISFLCGKIRAFELETLSGLVCQGKSWSKSLSGALGDLFLEDVFEHTVVGSGRESLVEREKGTSESSER